VIPFVPSFTARTANFYILMAKIPSTTLKGKQKKKKQINKKNSSNQNQTRFSFKISGS